MKVTTHCHLQLSKPISEMEKGSIGIIAHAPDYEDKDLPGMPVVRAELSWYFPASGDTLCGADEDILSDFRFRPLQPGERIVIEG